MSGLKRVASVKQHEFLALFSFFKKKETRETGAATPPQFCPSFFLVSKLMISRCLLFKYFSPFLFTEVKSTCHFKTMFYMLSDLKM